MARSLQHLRIKHIFCVSSLATISQNVIFFFACNDLLTSQKTNASRKQINQLDCWTSPPFLVLDSSCLHFPLSKMHLKVHMAKVLRNYFYLSLGQGQVRLRVRVRVMLRLGLVLGLWLNLDQGLGQGYGRVRVRLGLGLG